MTGVTNTVVCAIFSVDGAYKRTFGANVAAAGFLSSRVVLYDMSDTI